ncbi:MAG: family 10 glycosylhydrolase [Ignavibacteriales bacterium]|nr:family 10 glycosylhydrolase [Ignavibacteriales bacterium]
MTRKLIYLFFILISINLFSQSPLRKSEMRGVWVASLGIDWPKTQGTSSSAIQAQKNELVALFNSHKSYGMNAIFFHVRPMCDAVYNSKIEPWSAYLTGDQGVAPSDPNYDPLKLAIEEAHKRGMELHAWLNPYRAESSGGSAVSANHVINKHPEWIIKCNGSEYRFLNPGLPEVRNYVVNVIMDIVRRYDVDGIHFDDYFYPYTDYGSFNDNATFQLYPNGFTDKANWRENNVNLLLTMINDSIKAVKPWIKFGISPSGNPGVNSSIFCDPVVWLKGDYVDENGVQQTGPPYIDYILPQLYWVKYNGNLSYWSGTSFLNGRHLYIGEPAYRYTTTDFSVNELGWEITTNRNTPTVNGCVYFSSKSVTSNLAGCNDSLKYNYYIHPSSIPKMDWLPGGNTKPNAPSNLRFEKNASSNKYELHWDKSLPASDGDTAFAYLIYRFNITPVAVDDAANIFGYTGTGENYLPSAEAKYSVTKGNYYVVTAIDRYGNESDASAYVLFYSADLIPGKPELISPANGDASQPATANLKWGGVTNAERYQIQVSKDPSFNTINYNLFEYKSLSILFNQVRPGNKYYWRVKAFGVVGESEFSDVFNFSSGIPLPPTLIEPEHANTQVVVTPTFKWHKSSNTTSYHLKLSTSVQFSNGTFIIDKVVNDTFYTITTQLATLKNYYWRVSSKNSVGEGDWSAQFGFRTRSTVDVRDENGIPITTKLNQNYPNPFNPSTVISYQLSGKSNVSLKIFDVLGNEVITLIEQEQSGGFYNYPLSISNYQLPSGIYFYRLQTDNYIETRKLIILK